MYQPAHFAESRLPELQALMHDHPLATLVTLNGGALNANHLPFEYDPSPAPYGTLRAHIARNNPLWRDLAAGVESLVIFQGGEAYVSPSLYPSKAEHGKAVPTWNYMVVHASGPLVIKEDADWLRALVTRLTDRFEAGRAQPWAVDDAPADYLASMLRAIVGIEIPVTALVGKWKVSQNRPPADQAGVIEGLRAEGHADLAAALQERQA